MQWEQCLCRNTWHGKSHQHHFSEIQQYPIQKLHWRARTFWHTQSADFITLFMVAKTWFSVTIKLSSVQEQKTHTGVMNQHITLSQDYGVKFKHFAEQLNTGVDWLGHLEMSNKVPKDILSEMDTTNKLGHKSNIDFPLTMTQLITEQEKYDNLQKTWKGQLKSWIDARDVQVHRIHWRLLYLQVFNAESLTGIIPTCNTLELHGTLTQLAIPSTGVIEMLASQIMGICL